MDQRTLSIVGVGFVAGAASGLLGVGGGIVMVPLLVIAAGLSQHQAHVTSLAAIVPIAAAGAIPFAVNGDVDYGVAALLAAGSLFGARLGARMLPRISEGMLKTLFGCLLVLVSIVMIAT